MRRLILSLSGFLVLYIFAQNFAEAAPKSTARQMPYKCHELKANQVKQFSEDDIEYHFKGICTVKTPDGEYQDLWITSKARWQGDTHSASERITVLGNGGGVLELSMKCENDPWQQTDARCVLLNFGNTTAYASLVSIFRVKKKQWTVGYPPISRDATGIATVIAMNQASAAAPANAEEVEEAPPVSEPIAEAPIKSLPLPLSGASQPKPQTSIIPEPTPVLEKPVIRYGTNLHQQQSEDPPLLNNNAQANRYRHIRTAENDTENNTENETIVSRIVDAPDFSDAPDSIDGPDDLSQYDISMKKFFKPIYNGMRVHWCDSRNRGCGMRAANRWCKTRGYDRADTYSADNNIGRTVHMKNGMICRSTSCDGFASITCANG